MKYKLIIFGAGGFSKSIIDSLDSEKYELTGFIDRYKSGIHQSYPILGNDISEIDNKDEFYYFIGVGQPSARKFYLNLVRKYNLKLINVIDKTALLSNEVTLGEGVFIGKLCILNRGCTIHDAAVINTRALIEHGNEVGLCSNISTNVVLNGDVHVGEETFIGSCTVVNGQIRIGSKSVIGSGSVVIRNIPNNVVVAGSPTRLIREINE